MTTIRIQIKANHSAEEAYALYADIVRDAFPEAVSITVDSEDGTSETIYTRKEK